MKSEVFFFVTTVAVVVITALLAVLFYHLLRIFSDIRDMTRRLRGEAKKITNDMEEFRLKTKSEGLYSVLKRIIAGKGRPIRNTNKKNESQK